MARWSTIIAYRDFWDIPRAFLTVSQDKWLYFDCPFDEVEEDYETKYEVYEMPSLSQEIIAGDWRPITSMALKRLGTVPTGSVEFDATKRRMVNLDVLDKLATPG